MNFVCHCVSSVAKIASQISKIFSLLSLLSLDKKITDAISAQGRAKEYCAISICRYVSMLSFFVSDSCF